MELIDTPARECVVGSLRVANRAHVLSNQFLIRNFPSRSPFPIL
jgi:hypothetical protein